MEELTISFKIENPPAWISIGRTAENNWRTVEIDCSYWFNMSADGEVVLMYKPSCGMSPYPLLTEREGDNIIWRPKSGELVEGVGRLQAFFEVGTDVIGSSDMISCEVDSSLLGVEPGTDPGQTELPWALDIIERIAELSGHYPKIIDGDLYIWDSTLNEWVEFEAGGSGGGAVESVNGKTGAVVLGASDVHALPETYVAPVQSVNGMTGAVTIPIPTVPQMATDPDMSDWTSGKTVDASAMKKVASTANTFILENSDEIDSLKSDKQNAPLEIPVTESGDTYSTTATAEQIRAAKENSVFVLGDEMRIKALVWFPWDEGVKFLAGMHMIGGAITTVGAIVAGNSVSIGVERTPIPTAVSELANDSGFVNASEAAAAAPVQSVNGQTGAVTIPIPSLSGYATETWVEGKGYQTAQDVQTAIAGKADKTQRITMTAQDTTPTLDPNKLYVFPEMASLTPTLATPSDATIVNEYHFMFTSGATATTLTIPATINQPDGFTVEANHVYEVSILEGCMTAQGWAVS